MTRKKTRTRRELNFLLLTTCKHPIRITKIADIIHASYDATKRWVERLQSKGWIKIDINNIPTKHSTRALSSNPKTKRRIICSLTKDGKFALIQYKQDAKMFIGKKDA